MADPEAPWQVLERHLLVDRSPFARIYGDDVRLPDGQVISDFIHVELPDFVIVFACLEDGRVPFVRQYRQAVRAYTLELPAGRTEEGEESLIAAQRELREEAGAEASTWQFLGKYVMDANRGCGWAHVYLAQGARLILPPDPRDLGEMTLHVLSLDEVRRAWAAGELVSAPTALAVSLALDRLEA